MRLGASVLFFLAVIFGLQWLGFRFVVAVGR
jgi:hypothetical protein